MKNDQKILGKSGKWSWSWQGWELESVMEWLGWRKIFQVRSRHDPRLGRQWRNGTLGESAVI